MGVLNTNNFPCDFKWDNTQIDFINPTDNDVTIDVFNSITLSNFPSSPSGSPFPNSFGFSAIGVGTTRFAAFCPVNQFIYISRVDLPRVRVIDTVTNTPVTNINMPIISAREIAYCSVNNRMYLCADGFINVIDCATNTFVTSIPLTVVGIAWSISYNPTLNCMYVCQPPTDLVYKIDCATNTVVASTGLGGGDVPVIVRYNPTTDHVYVFGNANPIAYELNPVTLAINAPIVIPETAGITGAAALVSSNNSIYYQNSAGDIRQFFCASNTVNPTVIPFPAATLSITYNSTSDLIYVSNYLVGADSVRIYNPATNTLVQTVSTPIANVGNFGSLVFQSVKNSIYSISSPYNTIPNNFGVLEMSSSNNFYIVSPYNYNALLQDIQTNPMLIRRIELITQSQEQFAQPFSIMTRDANGMQAIIPRLPNIELTANQVQPNIASIDFSEKELILDDNTMFSQYTFPKKSVTRMLIFYKQLNRIDIVTKGISQCVELERHMNLQGTSVAECDLRQLSNKPLVEMSIKNEQKRQSRMATKMKFMDRLKK